MEELPSVFPAKLVPAKAGNGNFLFLVMPDNVNRESLPIAVIPDIVYRESILVSFRMDTRLQLAGMTAGGWIPA